MLRPIIITLFILLVFSSCAKRSLSSLHKEGVKVSGSQALLNVSPACASIRMQYLGCGGFFIQHQGQAIMIDPFFSHQSFLRIGKSIFPGGKIKSKRRELDYGRRMIKDSLGLTDDDLKLKVKGIFAAHGHYDHLMDVPFIYHEWLNENADVFVNTSSALTCANVINPRKLHDVQTIASVRDQRGDSVEFQQGQAAIRVYPIFADHNPHSRNVKLFAGSAVRTPQHFKSYEDKTSVNDWLEGQTLSFLIDFLENDSIQFRMFIQSSSCQFPYGIPPLNLLQEREIDLAVLGVASYHFSENTYPCEFLQTLQPKKLMFIHWEDFFRKLRKRPKAVKTNDIPRFFSDVLSKCSRDYLLPVPGSVITITR
ncbi:MAG TPA: hypothetical protein VGD40_19330 [Chryseosolibacter sp.]